MTDQRRSRPAGNGEAASTTTSQVDATESSRVAAIETNGLRAALEAAGGSLKDLTVLATQNDPFRCDTPAGHRDGQWLADRIAALRLSLPKHLRGLHYILIGQPKPNGEPYTNTDKDWLWLATPAKAARWLRYVPFDAIVDQRNAAPEIREWTPSSGPPWRYVSVNFHVDTDVVRVPDAHDLTPRANVFGFNADQPYHLVLVGEKHSLKDVLATVADNHRADLYLPTGEMSDTMAHTMASSAVADVRPLVVFYFADCDPAGWQMPISLSRKLQALKELLFGQLEFQVRRVGLTPDQVRLYGLPSTPLKDTEKRADRWKDATGVEQTEIDALAALRSDVLRQIANEAIAPFYDRTLNSRVYRARWEWQEQAQQAVDEQAAEHVEQIHAEVVPLLEEKRDEINAILGEIQQTLDDVRVDAAMFDLPEIPPVPEPQLDDDPPEPLCDSRWDFAEQCRRLIASKNYDGAEMGGES